MGYSIAAPMKSRQVFDQMQAFIPRHVLPWKAVVAGTPIIPSEDCGVATRLPYSHVWANDRKLCIGYDYPSWISFEERNWAYAIVTWLAVQAGRRARVCGQDRPVPYFLYDGTATAILVRSDWPELNPNELGTTGQFMVDDRGFAPIRRWYKYMPDGATPRSDEDLKKLAEAPEDIKLQLGTSDERNDLLDKLIEQELDRLTTAWRRSNG